MDGLQLCLDTLATAGAAFALLRIWFCGSAFAEYLEYARAWSTGKGPKALLGSLLSCRLCLSVQVSLFLGAVFLLPTLFLPASWANLLRLPVYALAANALIPLRLLTEDHDNGIFPEGPGPSSGGPAGGRPDQESGDRRPDRPRRVKRRRRRDPDVLEEGGRPPVGDPGGRAEANRHDPPEGGPAAAADGVRPDVPGVQGRRGGATGEAE